MSKVIRIKKGLDISLQGKADKKISDIKASSFYALKPTDFSGLTPKLSLKPGAQVKAGTPLFFDKYNTNIVFTSPVSGTVSAVNRGERRRILEVVVESDGKNEYESFKKANPKDLSKEEIKENILKSGCWAFIKQRPYAVIAKPDVEPRDIFISTFDSSPLAPDYNFIAMEQISTIQTAIDALAKLTSGKVHIGINSDDSPFKFLQNVEINTFQGPHPAGNAGVQINQIKPVNKDEVVWTINALDLLIIGRLFEKGIYDATRTIALTGSEVKNPQYYKTLIGTPLKFVVQDNIKTDEEVRYISGNVLTGEKIIPNNFIGFYDSQITVIPEGNKDEFLGWGMPGLKKFSASRSFIAWMNPKKERRLTAAIQGGERPFIVSGEFEKVFPMDIFPVHLLKAILIEDIDLMEELGIYEVAEEDFALCEVISTSKIEAQKIVREGLDMMIKEFS